MIALDRTRLEADRDMRRRAFFARALRGYLQAAEYADLVLQLGELATIVGGPEAAGLRERQQWDLSQLPPCELAPSPPTLKLMEEACRRWDQLLDPAERWVACVGVVGTSWTLEAAAPLGRRYPNATTLLQELGTQGPLSLRRLRAHSGRHRVSAAANLVRGSLLGLATHLDSTWPATLSLVT